MRKKILLAGALALIIIAIFVFFSKNDKEEQLKTEGQRIKNENIAKRNSFSKIKSPKTKPTKEDLEQFSDEELEAALAFLDSLDEESTYEELEEKTEDIQPGASEVEPPEMESSKTKISPELEKLFIELKQFADQERAIALEALPFTREYTKLKYRKIEIMMNIGNADKEERKRLREELQWIDKRMKTLHAIKAPFEEQRRQLRNEFEQKHGMPIEELAKKFEEEYRSWKAGL